MCVLMLLYAICVIILLYMCPYTIYAANLGDMLAGLDICVLILLYVSSYCCMCVLILYTHAHTHAGLVASFQSMSRQPFSDLGSVTSAHVRASDTLSTVSTSSEVSKSKANVVRVSPHMLVACEGLSTSDQSVLKPQYGKCRTRLTSRRTRYNPILRP